MGGFVIFFFPELWPLLTSTLLQITSYLSLSKMSHFLWDPIQCALKDAGQGAVLSRHALFHWSIWAILSIVFSFLHLKRVSITTSCLLFWRIRWNDRWSWRTSLVFSKLALALSALSSSSNGSIFGVPRIMIVFAVRQVQQQLLSTLHLTFSLSVFLSTRFAPCLLHHYIALRPDCPSVSCCMSKSIFPLMFLYYRLLHGENIRCS